MTTLTKQQSGDSQLYWVRDNVIHTDFPSVDSALRDPDGLLAIGGDLSSERLLEAYARGIFPWYSEGQPILWWSPNPRCVLQPQEVKISRSLAKVIRQQKFSVSYNECFERIIHCCARARDNNSGTWITQDMLQAYTALHENGHAVSVESWHGEQLAGGIYGVVIGKIFFGESMFSEVSNASKVALVHLCQTLHKEGFRLIDCQVYSAHLQSLGAVPVQREFFINSLNEFCPLPSTTNWPEGRVLA